MAPEDRILASLDSAVVSALAGNVERAQATIQGLKATVKPVEPVKPETPVKAVKPVRPVKPVKPVKADNLEADQAILLLRIAEAQVTIGDFKGARETFIQVTTSAPDMFRSGEPGWLQGIFDAQLRAGDIGGAQTTAASWNPLDRAGAYAALYQWLGNREEKAAAEGMLKLALAAAEDGKKANLPDGYIPIADAMASLGDFDAAKALVNRAELAKAKPLVFARIAERQSRTGDTPAAKASLTVAKAAAVQVGATDEANKLIATVQSSLGNLEEALVTARKINTEKQQEAYVAIALARIGAGDTAGAKRTISTAFPRAVQNPWEIGSTAIGLWCLAEALAKQGNVIGAEEVELDATKVAGSSARENVLLDKYRQKALVAILAAKLNAGDETEALEGIEKREEDPRRRLKIYRAAARDIVSLSATATAGG